MVTNITHVLTIRAVTNVISLHSKLLLRFFCQTLLIHHP